MIMRAVFDNGVVSGHGWKVFTVSRGPLDWEHCLPGQYRYNALVLCIGTGIGIAESIQSCINIGIYPLYFEEEM